MSKQMWDLSKQMETKREPGKRMKIVELKNTWNLKIFAELGETADWILQKKRLWRHVK